MIFYIILSIISFIIWKYFFRKKGQDIKGQTGNGPRDSDAESLKACSTPDQDIKGQTSNGPRNTDAESLKTCSTPGVKRLLHDFKDLFLNELETDVILTVEKRHYRAHKIILMARSPVFAAMWKHDMKEKRSNNVNIIDCDPEAFRDFLVYLYCGQVEELSSSNALHLYKAADKYGVEDLKADCVQFLKYHMSEGAFCSVLSFALQHEEDELLQEAIYFFGRNMENIVVMPSWQNFLQFNPVAANELIIKSMKYRGVWSREIDSDKRKNSSENEMLKCTFRYGPDNIQE